MNDTFEILIINHKNGIHYHSTEGVVPKNVYYCTEPNIIFQDGLFIDTALYDAYYLHIIRLLSMNEYKYPDIDDDDNFKYDEIVNIYLQTA